MTDLLHTTQTALLDWTSKAINAGWLAPDTLEYVKAINAATPSELFSGPDRPLVVGFFGGTGVGKSSLMNRLAGEPVARASAERPTSTDITAYVHTSIRVDRLPPDFPMEKLRTAMHHNADYASVLWLDMPDFDSVETSHRGLVEQWLPYIDVLVYVVSPERYRDDEGWRLLLQHGQRHAWLFVINHWDRGDPVQRDDFQALLQSAGMNDPLVFCTDCNPHQPATDDDFAQFDQTIRSLADTQLIKELEKRGIFQRLNEMQKTITGLETALGDPAVIDQWRSHWAEHWSRHSDEINQAVQWQIPTLAEDFTDTKAPFWLRWIPGINRQLLSMNLSDGKTDEGRSQNPVKNSVGQLLDDVTLQRIDDAAASFTHDARTAGVHTDALVGAIARRRAELPARLTQTATTALQASLHKPGEAWQRALHKGLGFLTTLLPVLVLGWAAYKLVNGFVDGEPRASGSHYLGINFAVHTVMLAGLAWIVPYLLYKKTRPSRIRAAQRGLRQGLEQALAEVEQHIDSGIEQSGRSRETLIADLRNIQSANANNNAIPQLSETVTRLMVS